MEDLPLDSLQDPIWERSGHRVRGRDGCRVPLPWTGDAPALGFGAAAAWLPQPTEWKQQTVEVQTDDPTSMLALYREALRVRRSLPDLAGDELRWQAHGEDVLAFDRGTEFRCVVNLGSEPVELPADAEVLLASAPLADGVLRSDVAAWLRIRK